MSFYIIIMRTITSHLMGGLGNQLFQIFLTISYGITNKIKFVFPFSEVLTDGIERPTYWDSFLKSLKIFTTHFIQNKFSNDELYQFTIYRENGFNYQSIPNFTSNVMLYGYWQSYKYFDSKKDQIFQLLCLKKTKESVKNEYSRYFDENSKTISMHFRLGDYKTKQDYHPILPYTYYHKSLEYILDCSIKQEDDSMKIRVLYFCEKEDNATVLEMIQKMNTKYPELLFIKVDDNIVDWKQMILMSCCDYNIIANSTFSWWAAYMNDSEKKIVCYPSLWFGKHIIKTQTHNEYMKDLYPETWKKIEI
jgi:hypothetical protein